MRARTHLVATAVAAGTVGALLAGGIGHLTGMNTAQAKASRAYTLRVRDRVDIPSVGQRCNVYIEGGSPELFCAQPRGARHQVTFYRDIIFVWKAGNPDRPAWSGKP